MVKVQPAARSGAVSAGELGGLHDHLLRLVGEPFRFLRFSYGDELRVHLGDLLPGRPTKFGIAMHGSYDISLRASPWILKSSSGSVVHSAGFDGDQTEFERRLTTDEKKGLEADPLIAPDARVLAAHPFVDGPGETIALQLKFSDGSSVAVLPPSMASREFEDEDLKGVADWEVLSPGGLLAVGPGLKWSFKPKAAAASA